MTTSPRIGVDIGGTFTDVVTIVDGAIRVHKTASTPETPARAVETGLAELVTDRGLALADVGVFAHGTTVATNAVLEERWAETALVTTAGFRDVLAIGRQDRPALYDLQAEQAPPVVPRHRRYEIAERLDERGAVREPLEDAAIDAIVEKLATAGVDSVAISLLFAYENDAHERRLAEHIRAADLGVAVSRSSAVLPEIREYERTLTTALNAALVPVMDDYLGALETRLAEQGVPVGPAIMQSNGGIIDVDRARRRPVDTLLSGPAAGVQGAKHVAGLGGREELITMDMGGTSCDVCLIEGGEPAVATDLSVGPHPVGVPMVDIHTIGAGGSSVAWVDDGGALRVGPRSAGARPGPICYGRGGTEPTITDAQLLLGRLAPDTVSTGGAAVARERVASIVERELATPLNLSVEEAAEGVLTVANASMERALREVSVERGHDPRAYGLVAFGGAGPLHAGALADRLGIPEVVVPWRAGALSALGLLLSDRLYEFSRSMVRPWQDVDPATLADTFEGFAAEGRAKLAADGLADHAVAIERSLELRYAGQSYELAVDVPRGSLDAAALATIRERFDAAHERRYGHADPTAPVELVTLRARARGVVDPPELRPADVDGTAADAHRTSRQVVLDGESHRTAVYDREALPVGATLTGPAIVEGTGSTALVRPGQTATVGPHASLRVELDP